MTTLHSAFIPQVPGQGSTHLLLTQALLRSQSELVTHSGRQPLYGSPKYSGKHAHDPAPFLSLHTALAPQGDGLHGLVGLSVTGAAKRYEKYSFEGKEISLEWGILRGGMGEHPVKGSPVYPDTQTQTGECLRTVHVVLEPQDPGQGSLHFSF